MKLLALLFLLGFMYFERKKMKVCRRALDWLQVINAEGDVRVCSWMPDGIIGNLGINTITEIMRGDKHKEILKPMAEGKFPKCHSDNCPYMSNNAMDEILINIDKLDDLPSYPETLYLAYEGNCNYQCTCCSSKQHMVDTKQNDYRKQYDALEKKLKEILPYVKTISANGRGELFTSPRIMNLLREWHPMASFDDVNVILETNGSLFNRHNWKKIEHLGRYNLQVLVTVMSFDEDTYQYLSGTNYPITVIEENLLFIKELRKSGIINYVEIATVMQELNFREMPSFTKRCIEEYEADCVRIRPIFRGGDLPDEIQWFMDVRNTNHPYYDIYNKIMKDPIFNDSRVLLWSNDLPSGRGVLPSLRLKQQIEVMKRINKIVKSKEIGSTVQEFIPNGEIAIYGLGKIGTELALSLIDLDRIHVIYDVKHKGKSFHSISVKDVKDSKYFDGTVIITPYGRFDEMKKELNNAGFQGNIIYVDDILCRLSEGMNI